MRSQSARTFLKMIRGQPAIFRSYEMFKVQPGGTRQQPQFTFLRRFKLFYSWRIRLTDACGDEWSKNPAQQKRRSHEQSQWIEEK